MAAAGDTFLSDVHLYTPFERSNNVTGKAFTRFCIRSPQQSLTEEAEKETSTSHSISERETDRDGDLVLSRHCMPKEISDVITIEHYISTILQDVGLQVWRGALLLCDFLVHNSDRFDECSALELGAGVGLCSIVLGRVAKRVICTDVGEDVLKNCLVNVMNNAHICKHSSDEDSVVKVRQLDWLAPELSTDKSSIFHWSEADKEELQNVDYIFAADVVYDDQLTDGFFQVVTNCFRTGSHKVLYLSLEKRLNFTLEDLDVACVAYEYFLSMLESLAAKDESIKFRRVATNFPQYLSYERVKELEIWEIQPS